MLFRLARLERWLALTASDDLGDDVPSRRGAPDEQLMAEQVGG